MRNLNYKLLIFILIILVIILIFPYIYLFKDNINDQNGKNIDLHIKTGSTYTQLLDSLKKQNIIKNIHSFEMVSSWLKYDKGKVHSGRYILKPNMGNLAIVRLLKSGNQTSINLTFNNVRTINELAGKISQKLEIDSIEICTKAKDSLFLSTVGLDSFNVMTLFIPNTYNIFWDISVDEFFERIKEEHNKFWEKDNRKNKASNMNMTPEQVYTLASIVEKETIVSEEKDSVASVYLNRLNSGMRLQADPTVVFASGDFTINRIYYKLLELNSPYNTYRHEGLPPGPICMPDVETIDAVLKNLKTDFLYFCASPAGNGRHLFAVTHEEHVKNANKYRNHLDEMKVQ